MVKNVSAVATTQPAAAASTQTLTGELAFRRGVTPQETGVFLTSAGATRELLAVSRAARQALGELDEGGATLHVHVEGRIEGRYVEASAIRVLGRAANVVAAADRFEAAAAAAPQLVPLDSAARAIDGFGRSLLALYAACEAQAKPAATPPRRLGNMYFHPDGSGRSLEVIALGHSPVRTLLALVDTVSRSVWFRRIDYGPRTFTDVTTGPFATPETNV